MKTWIENNFAIVLLLGGVIGFFVPSMGDEVNNKIIVFLIGALVYFACPSIKRADLLDVDIFQVGLFTLIRFAIFPIVLFYLATMFIPNYAIGILLLSLMPSAMAVASLCMISGGKTALGISLTIIASILTPVLVPSVFAFLGHQVEVNEIGLFVTLVLVLFVPFIVYFYGTSRLQKHKKWVADFGKMASILTMAFLLLIILSSYKEQFLDNLDLLLKGGFIMFGLFFLFYLFGFVFSYFVPKDQRSTYILSSGAINNGLAIGLSFIYFSPETTFFIVISEIVWCLYVAAAQWYFSRRAAASI